MEKLKSEASNYSLEESRWRRQDTELWTRLANLEKCLGTGDPEREETYWRLVQELKAQIKSLGEKPLPAKTTSMDIEKITEFLDSLDSNWERYPKRQRNRLLTMLIDRLELRHDRKHIEATIVWKVGLRQVVNIKRLLSPYKSEKRWQPEEDNLLRMLWSSASWDTLLAALPERTPTGISIRAFKLKLKRKNFSNSHSAGRPWTGEDDNRLKEMYSRGVSIAEIVSKLGRTEQSVTARAKRLALQRPKEIGYNKVEAVWEKGNFKVIHALSTQ